MKYPGGLTENLRRAVANAKRQNDTTISPTTIDYWRGMIAEAWKKIEAGGSGTANLTRLVLELDEEISRRIAAQGRDL